MAKKKAGPASVSNQLREHIANSEMGQNEIAKAAGLGKVHLSNFMAGAAVPRRGFEPPTY